MRKHRLLDEQESAEFYKIWRHLCDYQVWRWRINGMSREDIEQELGAHLVKRWRTYQPDKGSKKSYFGVIARNFLTNLARNNKRQFREHPQPDMERPIKWDNGHMLSEMRALLKNHPHLLKALERVLNGEKVLAHQMAMLRKAYRHIKDGDVFP